MAACAPPLLSLYREVGTRACKHGAHHAAAAHNHTPLHTTARTHKGRGHNAAAAATHHHTPPHAPMKGAATMQLQQPHATTHHRTHAPMKGAASASHSRMHATAAVPSGVGHASRTSRRTKRSSGMTRALNSSSSRCFRLSCARGACRRSNHLRPAQLCLGLPKAAAAAADAAAQWQENTTTSSCTPLPSAWAHELSSQASPGSGQAAQPARM